MARKDVALLLDSLPQLIWVTRHEDGAIEHLNQRWQDFTGMTQEEAANGGWRQALHPDDIAPHTAAWYSARSRGAAFQFEYRLRHHVTGKYHWFLVQEVPTRERDDDPDSAIVQWIGTATDISERKQLEALLARREAALIEAQTEARIGSWELDLVTGKRNWSAEMFRLLQFSPEEEEPEYERALHRIHPDDTARVEAFVAHTSQGGGPYEDDIRLLHEDGTINWVHFTGRGVRDTASGEIVAIRGTLQDITERKRLEAEKDALLAAATRQANHDSLTGLLNRHAFRHQFDRELECFKADRSTPLAIFLIDLDNFKFFNDAYGHAAGDEVLRQVTTALERAIYDDTDPPFSLVRLARLGGDEFAALISVSNRREANALVFRIKSAVADSGYHPEGHSAAIPISVSCGFALIPDETPPDAESALTLADERLYHDKMEGREFWSVTLRTELGETIMGFSMLDALVTAVDAKDRYTRRHSEDVLVYSGMIGHELGLSAEELYHLKIAALLHDVGKIGVPDRILRLPGALTESEFDAIRQHPALGTAIVAGAAPDLAPTLPAIRNHHEGWDGKGYPDALAGEEIPKIARIMAVADAFSAMTTNRPYRVGMLPAKALAILEEGAGSQWDKECVAAFVAAYKKANP